jgi:pantoate--beta-alanine ligase
LIERLFGAISIFVNPTQFAAHEDLGKYPRTMEADLAMCADAGVDVVFAPESPTVMYPPPQPQIVTLRVAGAETLAEGACRPHFFHAVATVCIKLFNITQVGGKRQGEEKKKRKRKRKRKERKLEMIFFFWGGVFCFFCLFFFSFRQ